MLRYSLKPKQELRVRSKLEPKNNPALATSRLKLFGNIQESARLELGVNNVAKKAIRQSGGFNGEPMIVQIDSI